MNTQSLSMNTRLPAALFALVVGFFMLTTVPTVEAGVVDSGAWTKKQYKIKGDWELDVSGDQTIIRFHNNFKTKKGPDLKVFLSKKSIKDVTGRNATQDAVLVAVLKSNKGAQEYVLPANININDYDSLLIHCEAFSVLWGGANFAHGVS